MRFNKSFFELRLLHLASSFRIDTTANKLDKLAFCRPVLKVFREVIPTGFDTKVRFEFRNFIRNHFGGRRLAPVLLRVLHEIPEGFAFALRW
ncbi:hypothetical protein B4067_1294 [Bacillus subtilis subsp. subtilis]|uniref:Uncharacterized protein n=1 Tax=Bacillus subtilis subsp. subtilis TaxID=135461 RepID=A0ABD3ZQ55_BACIU|nr:hypothetical protein B4067_1294 [Bacillus subtilis subsp. subtilis]